MNTNYSKIITKYQVDFVKNANNIKNRYGYCTDKENLYLMNQYTAIAIPHEFVTILTKNIPERIDLYQHFSLLNLKVKVYFNYIIDGKAVFIDREENKSHYYNYKFISDWLKSEAEFYTYSTKENSLLYVVIDGKIVFICIPIVNVRGSKTK